MSNHLNPPRIYIGYDPREDAAYRVAEYSIRRRASGPVTVVPLELTRLRAWQLLQRPYTIKNGRLWDILSDAPCATEFSLSRFLTPLLAMSGWSLFMDCDMLILGDIYELFAMADDRYACMCVKHNHEPGPSDVVKMDNQIQTVYPRKNWSSVVMWNSDHAANRLLTLALLNSATGRDLHRFSWLEDADIGGLPMEWNWLVGVQEKPAAPKIAHYTLGIPLMDGYEDSEHAELWMAEYRAMLDAAV